MTTVNPFVPVLTVLADVGIAGFLWIVREDWHLGGVGPNLCDAMDRWHESLPLSEGLFAKFQEWAIDFDNHMSKNGFTAPDDWDWSAFHQRGVLLARCLKEEVGDAYRVVYLKPGEDPNKRMDERREILLDGSLHPLPSFRPAIHGRLFNHIVSGGQAGADRAALDFAMEHGYTHGGWAPHGRLAEDGPIPLKYQLRELPSGGYRQRTRRNVLDSDGTLVVNVGELDGGTLATRDFAARVGKPCLVVQADAGISKELVLAVSDWLRQNAISTLNVAGPRESRRPGIYAATRCLLLAIEAHVRTATQLRDPSATPE